MYSKLAQEMFSLVHIQVKCTKKPHFIQCEFSKIGSRNVFSGTYSGDMYKEPHFIQCEFSKIGSRNVLSGTYSGDMYKEPHFIQCEFSKKKKPLNQFYHNLQWQQCSLLTVELSGI